MADHYQEGSAGDPRLAGDEGELYIDKMKRRVNEDFTSAREFMRSVHSQSVAAKEWYFNALRYEDMKKNDKFPVGFYQRTIDAFVAYIMDKLFYKGRPCTLTGVEESDKRDADVKQNMLDWQDRQDKIYRTMELCLKDAAMARIGVVQIDYVEETERRVVGIQEPEIATDNDPDSPTFGQELETGRMVSRTEVQDFPVYKGPKVKRIDPCDFFVTQDKTKDNDGEAMMIRSNHPISYFLSDKRGIFIQEEVQKLKTELGDKAEQGANSNYDNNVELKRLAHGLKVDGVTRNKSIEYIEWQALVNKRELYEYELMRDPEAEGKDIFTEEGKEIVGKYDTTLAIVGVANGKFVLRLEESPFDFQRPNIIVGVIQGDEAEIIGTSITDKISAVQQAKEVIMGMTIENLKQSVNAMHIIKTNALKNPNGAIVNKAGFVLETIEDVTKVHKRIEQAPIAKDLYIFSDILEKDGQDRSAMVDIIFGQGDPNAKTLGATQLIAGQAQLRMTDHLKTWEETFVAPMYDMRNQINMQFLDAPYVYGVVGDGAIDWRTIEPHQIRANVDFFCESASRETNRTVITQQIINLAKLAPIAAQMGFVIRFDILLAQLCEQGFSWSAERTESIFPTLKLERDGININEMLLQGMLLRMQLQAGGAIGIDGTPDPTGALGAAAKGGNSGPGGPAGEQPEPGGQQGADKAIRKQSETTVRSL